MLSDEMLAAATRYRESIVASKARATEERPTTKDDIIEMHEAVLGLMWATHTTTVEEALAVLDGEAG
jgi:hypothetical protein